MGIALILALLLLLPHQVAAAEEIPAHHLHFQQVENQRRRCCCQRREAGSGSWAAGSCRVAEEGGTSDRYYPVACLGTVVEEDRGCLLPLVVVVPRLRDPGRVVGREADRRGRQQLSY